MNLVGKKPTFRNARPQSNPYRMLIWLVLIVLGFWVVRATWVTKAITPPFLPTATPTRTTASFAQEAEAYFVAGNLDKAIEAYENASRVNPDNAELLAQLARIQVYKSKTESTADRRFALLQQALANVNQAKELAPEDSMVAAIRALVLDWNGTSEKIGEEGPALLVQAQQEAKRAIDLDRSNVLAQAYYAEILVDQANWTQAEQVIKQAVQLAEEHNQRLMDVYRVYGQVLETGGYYRDAIEQYLKAAEINQNLTFLYIEVGVIYRHLEVYDKALDYFQKAVDINNQIGVKDPIPYIGIAKTYTQKGDFYIASRNVIRALQLDPTSQDVYGQLGIVLTKSKNYEGAIPAFQCALEGCPPEVSCEVRECNTDTDPAITLTGMDLTASTEVYYYTYGSILAGLHRRGDDKCVRAMQVFSQIRAQFSDDPIAMSIVQAGETICSKDSSPQEAPGGPTPAVTVTPGAAPPPAAPTPTATPAAQG